MSMILVALAFVQEAGSVARQTDDIVVTGSRRCDLAAVGRRITGSELDQRAAEWRSGRTVRILVPASLRTRCLAKVMFRLQDRGVTTAEFIDVAVDGG